MGEEDEKKKKKKKKSKEDEETGTDTAKEEKKKKKKKKDKDGGDTTEAAATAGESEVDDKKKKKKKKKDTEGETNADEAKDDPGTGRDASTLKAPELAVSPPGPSPGAGISRQDFRVPTRVSQASRASRASQERAPSQLSIMPPIDRRASIAPSDARRPSVAPPEVRRPSMAPSSVSNLLPALNATNQLQQQARAAPLPAQQPAGSADNGWWDKEWQAAPRRVIPPVSKDTWAKMELLNKRLMVEPKQVKFEDEALPDRFDLTMEYYTDGLDREKDKKGKRDKSDKDTDKDTDKEKGKKKKKDKKKDKSGTSDNELDDTEEDRDKKKKKKDKKKDKSGISDNELDDTEEDTDTKKKKKKDKKKDRTTSDNEFDDTEDDTDTKKKKKKDKKKDRTTSDNEFDDTEDDRDTKKKKREKKSKSASDAERDPPRRSSIRPQSEKGYGDEEDSEEDSEIDAMDFNPVEVVDPRMARIMARISDARADPTESQLVDPLFPAKCECCSDRNNYTRGIIRDETVVARPHFIQKTIEDGLMVNRRDNGLGFYRSDSRVLIPVSNYVEKHLSTEMMNAGYSHEEARKIEHIRTKANQAIPPNLIEWPYYPNGPALAQELERYVGHDAPTSSDGFVLSDTINDSSTKLDDAMRRLKKSINRF